MAEQSKVEPVKMGGIFAKREESRRCFYLHVLLGTILILAVILVYSPVWRAGFVWDDDIVVTTNPVIVGPLGLTQIWTTHHADICPLTLTTFWFEHALWGLAPLPYHLVNIFVHAACAVLLWKVLRSLQVPGAWLGAALWAVHPVEVESVAWIAELKNTQSGLFFLLSVLFFVKWLRAKDADGHNGNRRDYALTLLFAALAMASKSSTVILPVVLCLCAWWMEGRWHWRNLARLLPVFLMSIAASALSMWTQGLSLAKTIDPQWARTWPQRLAAAGDAVWFYLGKLLWPHPLITIYPRWQIDAGQWVAYLPMAAAIGLLAVLWFMRESPVRPCFFVFAYFLAALLPALGLIDNFIFRYSLVFDHFQYLAGMGPLALIGAGLTRLADVVLPGRQSLRWILCAALLLCLGTVSWQRAQIYGDSETFWTDTVNRNPNCWMAYNNLGNALARKRRIDEAMADFQKSLEINPNDAEAHGNFGNALCLTGQVDQGIGQLQRALEINPNYVKARFNLGLIFSREGRTDEALSQFQKVLEVNPYDAEAHNFLGRALAQKGRLDAASAEFQAALRLKPGLIDAQKNLARVQAMSGQAPGSNGP